MQKSRKRASEFSGLSREEYERIAENEDNDTVQEGN